MPIEVERYKRANDERRHFLERFPIGKIKDLTLYDYAFSKTGHGNKDSFCNIMYTGLEDIAHTGNAYTHMYGVYYKENEPVLSSTYEKLFVNDVEGAFAQVKEDIYELLSGVGAGNIQTVERSRIHRTFRYKLLAVYFPDLFLPVCTKDMLEAVCRTMGIPFGNREMVYSNIELKELKESNNLTREWNNGVFLGFCRWIGNIYSTSDKRKIDVRIVAEIDDVDSLGLRGEEREAIVKIRINQGVFRDELIKRYGKCVLCGVKDSSLMIASHIKSWSDSNPEEKVDVDNVFLLCPNHDKLFDKGLISFDIMVP